MSPNTTSRSALEPQFPDLHPFHYTPKRDGLRPFFSCILTETLI